MLVPIVIFVYNRPWHTKQTVEALKKNKLANGSDIFVYSDGVKDRKAVNDVKEVRKYIKTIVGFKSVSIIEREKNYGLANNIIDGVTKVLSEHESVIVLEDDMVTSPYFLTYMNEALDRFANDERVVSTHGYVYPVRQQLPEAFFLTGADCWGWATWRRGWKLFNPDGQQLLDEIIKNNLETEFDYNNTYPYLKMLKEQINGSNDSWAIRWYASAFLSGKLTLYPGRSLVHNIGNDGSGTHCGDTETHDSKLSTEMIDLSNVEVMPSIMGYEAFVDFMSRSKRSSLVKIVQFIKFKVSGYLGA